jgi:hypothetical protein
MSGTDELITALAEARARLRRAKAELARHMQSEPDEDHAAQRHAHTERKLRDDGMLAQSDIEVLTRELTRDTQRVSGALEV